MAKEVRSILFTAEETRSAVAEFLQRRNRALTPPAVACVDIQVADGIVAAHAHTSRDRGDAPALLDADELLAAVLLHCRLARIPLSTRSAKRLDVSSGNLVLTMSINPEPARAMPLSAPAQNFTTTRVV